MARVLKVPKPTLERLPRYLRVLRQRLVAGDQYISSGALGAEIGVEEFQVRKDLSYVKAAGRPGKGYQIQNLIDALQELLGFTTMRDAVVVGAGRLGQALSQYAGFTHYGFRVVMLFDSDPEKIGQEVGGLPIMDVTQMPDLLRRMQISMAIITVPAEAAQPAADQLVLGGVGAFWNFAPVVLEVPPSVYVRNEDLAVGLASLSHHVARATKQKRL